VSAAPAPGVCRWRLWGLLAARRLGTLPLSGACRNFRIKLPTEHHFAPHILADLTSDEFLVDE
jgi:hypothetical protein